MAASQIKLTVIGYNVTAYAAPQNQLFNTTFIAKCYPYVAGSGDGVNIMTGANTTVECYNGGPAGAGTIKYYVSQTLDQIVALANVDTTPSLSVVGTFSASGFATFGSGVIFERTAVAINTSATIADGDMTKGYFTSTSASPVTITLRTATQLATELGAVAGSSYKFIIDNSAGASTVTLAVATGVTVGTTALTGGDSLTLSTAQAVGAWELIFTSATAAKLRRVY
jgi:hypothetical protein